MARNPQKRAHGGRILASGNPKVAKEAASTASGFKSGGKVCAMPGGMASKRIDKRARGGSVMSSAGGGSADKSPYSSARSK